MAGGGSAARCIPSSVKLTIWIPVEQVGVVIGRSGQQVNRIQSASSARVSVSSGEDKKSLWAPVSIEGEGESAFHAAQLVTEIVEEVDDAVAEFQLGSKARSLLAEKDELREVAKKVSAECNVRIRVPQDEAEAVTLEGVAIDVKKALGMVVEISDGKDPFAPKEIKRTVRVTAKSMRGRVARQTQQPLYRLVERASGTHISKLPKGEDSEEKDETAAAMVTFVVRGPEHKVEAVTHALRSIAEGAKPKDVVASLKKQFPPQKDKPEAPAPAVAPAKQEKLPPAKSASRRNKRGGATNKRSPSAGPEVPSPATAPSQGASRPKARAEAPPAPSPPPSSETAATDTAKASSSSQRSRRSRGGRRRASGGGGGGGSERAGDQEAPPAPAVAQQ